MYGSSKFVTQDVTGVIIPAVMHRIPSELRSKFVTQEMTDVIIPALMDWIQSELRSKFVTQEMTGAIIPALMHWIPSELRSYACFCESSTRMSDLLGSPRVAPLFLVWERPFQ
ncbi:hypothetical protein V6N12_046604 [Hibiscus sabdariffa]|uniref:Uncharacterized protein n=1 Tax=Hibiscus sabdariffa TaxID=183260 RepID=A0ABR2DJ48_9ROSI